MHFSLLFLELKQSDYQYVSTVSILLWTLAAKHDRDSVYLRGTFNEKDPRVTYLTSQPIDMDVSSLATIQIQRRENCKGRCLLLRLQHRLAVFRLLRLRLLLVAMLVLVGCL